MNEKQLSDLKEHIACYVVKTKEKSIAKQIEDFFAKGDTASFIYDLNIKDWFNFLSDCNDMYNLLEPHQVKGSPTYKKRQSFREFITTWIVDFPLYAGDDINDITLSDLKEAVAVGHWSFKYCDPKYLD